MSKESEQTKRSSLFRKLLLYLITSCALMALLCVLIICLSSAGAYARRIANEMVPRVHAIARMASRYQTGQISYDSFLDIALREQRGAQIYIIDQSGILRISSQAIDAQSAAFNPELAAYASQILRDGETYTWVNWRSDNGIVVGAPIRDNIMRISGAIIMTKPSRDVFASMTGLILIIFASCLIASALMIIPAYFGSKRLTGPIQRMTEISAQMANGDFSARADDGGNDEIAQLGGALNHLSRRLCENINDLTLAQNRLRVILEDMHDGVIALDADARIRYCNPAALSLFSSENEEMLLERLPELSDVCARAVESGEPQQLLVTRGERKLLLSVSRSQEKSDVAPGTIAVVQDVTARERLEQTRRDYVANVSHELRTPIASIRSLAEALDDGMVRSEEDRNRYYGYILRESMRLSRLINDLLELSRLQSGGVALETRPFDLAVLLDEVCERMGETAAYSGIRVKLSLAGGAALPVVSNRDRLEQVLVALMDNAIKFASDDGQIELSVRETPEKYWVCVRNTGHIAEADIPHIFERFYKADKAHADTTGTGLGLAIVREITELLGERILAENDGDAALFRFTVAKQALSH